MILVFNFFILLFFAFIDRNKGGVGEWEDGKGMREVGREEIMIRIYCMKKFSIK